MKTKRIASIFMALALLMSLVQLNAAAKPATNITVGTASGKQGDTVSVSVSLNSGSQMQAFSFKLEYDKDVEEVVSATKGSALSATPVINTNIAGKIVFSYAATNAVTSAGAVLNVSFKIKGNAPFGKSDLKLAINEFADGEFEAIDYTVKNGQIVVIAPKLEAPSEIQLNELGSTYAEIMWTGDDEATGYNIYLNGSLYNESPLTDNIYLFSELEQNSAYQVQITNLHYTVESDKTEVFTFQTNKSIHTVIFVDWNYNVLDIIEDSVLYVAEVEHGAAADCPVTPVREGYRFVSWDTDFSNVTLNLTVQAQYEQIYCDVTFIDWDGSVLSQQIVAYGDSAEAPEAPSREGYIFTTWDKPYTDVTEDITIQAQYAEATCKHLHTEVQGAIKSTCTVAGFSGNIFCIDCGEVISVGEKLELADHSYKSVVTPPTPTTQGYTTHKCSACGYQYIDSYTDYVEENPTEISVESKSATVGSTFTVNVFVENNKGFTYLELTPVIPEQVQLISVKNGNLISDLTQGKQYVWVADGDITANGLLMTFTFTTADGIEPGDYEISFIVRGCVNYDEQNVAVTVVSGKISIVNFTYGDANGDGVINGQDIIRIKKYLANYDYETGTSSIEIASGADANGDGVISGQDIVRLKKYLANYDYETDTSTIVLGPQK